jgi:hypothetical protein
MRWLHVCINAKVGQTETLTHTLNFRTAPAADVDQDEAAVQTFANQVRDIWHDWFTTPAALGNVTPQSTIGDHVAYQDVTAAYLEQTVPAVIHTHTSKKTGRPVKDFEYPKPTYLVLTQYAPFATPLNGGDQGARLPYEVACAISFKTRLRGPRGRGRLYLGGLTVNQMDPSGTFKPGNGPLWAGMFSDLVHRLNTGTGARLHVVSRAYATSEGVNGVTCGIVPDSQRRRRRSLKEAYPTVVAT